MGSLKADIIGRIIQKKVHQRMGRKLPANSFKPEAQSRKTEWGEKYIKINDLQYANVYPNSFLDLYLPNESGKKLPVLLYAHGGGFLFCGKDSGDAYANGVESAAVDTVGGFRGFVKQLLDMGIAVASMEYAMAPKYRFPVQIEQMEQAIAFLKANADTFYLDLSRLFLMGSSAGADMVEIYAAAAGNEKYAQCLGMKKMAVSAEDIKGVIIDESALTKDAPKDANALILDQVWFGETRLANCQNKKLSFAPDYIQSFPSSFINCSTEEVWFYDSTYPLYQALLELGIQTEFFMPQEGTYKHGYMMDYANDEMAETCLLRVKAFISEHL